MTPGFAATPARPEVRLPLWRLLAGLAVLGSLAAVLVALAPVYVRNYELARDVRWLSTRPDIAVTPDDNIRAQVLQRARGLRLPVEPGDVRIDHAGGRLQVELKYIVRMDLALYQVDLHFHSEAAGQPAP